MDDSGINWQSLAGALVTGLGAYADSQNTQPVYVSQPQQQTAYGLAGSAQPTPGATIAATAPRWLLYAGVALAAFLLLRK